MITAIIIDDELKSILILKKMLAEHCKEIDVVATSQTYSEGCRLINDQRPQLVFLDIEMADATGFDILNQFDPIFFQVVFVTAHSDYALKAFKFSVTDYLLKPIDVDDLVNAVKKAVRNIALQQLNSLVNKPSLTIRTTTGLLRIHPEDIVSIRAEGVYARLFLLNAETHLLTCNLGVIHEQLNQADFLRVHKSAVINIAYLKKYSGTGDSHVQMKDGSKIPVSRRSKAELTKRIHHLKA